MTSDTGTDRKNDGIARIAIGGVITFLGLSAISTAFIVFFVAAIFGVLFPIIFGLPFDDQALDERAATCAGRVTDVDYDPNYKVNNETTVVVGYECPSLQGHDEWKTRVVASDPLARVRPGDRFTVEYLPDDPDVSRIQGSKAALAGWAGAAGLICTAVGLLALLITVLVPVVGIAVLGSGIRRRAKWRREQAA